MSLLARAKRAALAAYESIDADADRAPTREAELILEIARLKDQYANHDRLVLLNKAYFNLIESILKQRDDWKGMFLKQSTENAAAQSYMNEQLEKANHVIGAVVTVINMDRKVAGKPLFELDKKIETGVSVKKRFEELLAELKAAAPEDADFMGERDAIADGGDVQIESGSVGSGARPDVPPGYVKSEKEFIRRCEEQTGMPWHLLSDVEKAGLGW